MRRTCTYLAGLGLMTVTPLLLAADASAQEPPSAVVQFLANFVWYVIVLAVLYLFFLRPTLRQTKEVGRRSLAHMDACEKQNARIIELLEKIASAKSGSSGPRVDDAKSE